MLPGLAHILALSDSVRRWLDYFSKLGQLQQEKLPKKLGNFAKVGSKFFSQALKNPQPNDKAKPQVTLTVPICNHFAQVSLMVLYNFFGCNR